MTNDSDSNGGCAFHAPPLPVFSPSYAALRKILGITASGNPEIDRNTTPLGIVT